MKQYLIKGTVMNLVLENCWISNNGTIMHIGGSNNHIENRGTITHNEGGRVFIMGGDLKQSTNEKVVYKDRIIYRDRTIRSMKDIRRIRELEERVQDLKQMIRDTSNINEIQRLRNKVGYLENINKEQEKQIKELEKMLDSTDRQELLNKIEDLKSSLKRSENRERTSRTQQYEKGYQAGVCDGSNKKKEVFDWGVKPKKEEAEKLLKQLRFLLDCED